MPLPQDPDSFVEELKRVGNHSNLTQLFIHWTLSGTVGKWEGIIMECQNSLMKMN